MYRGRVDYDILPIMSETFDILVMRTKGRVQLLIAVIYKPIGTNIATFSNEMNEICAQLEALDTDYTLFLGDFNHNLIDKCELPPFRQYQQVISKPTTQNGTLLDHIYIKPPPQQEYIAEVLTTYYSYHNPVAIAIKY